MGMPCSRAGSDPSAHILDIDVAPASPGVQEATATLDIAAAAVPDAHRLKRARSEVKTQCPYAQCFGHGVCRLQLCMMVPRGMKLDCTASL